MVESPSLRGIFVQMMLTRSTLEKPLPPGYSIEVDSCTKEKWYELLQLFDDASLYQTWAYGEVMYGSRNMGHLILRHHGRPVAAALARIARAPKTNIGIAYILWGPMWRRAGIAPDQEVLGVSIRALRNEYVCRRRLNLRIVPNLFDEDGPGLYSAILAEEGFARLNDAPVKRTIVMDLTPSAAELRLGMRDGWKKTLKAAERNAMKVVAGFEDRLFELFIGIYQEVLSRKKFQEPNSIQRHRAVQAQLPDTFKMKVSLCYSAEGLCAGHVWSEIGKTPLTLFIATANPGLKNGASYILEWRLIQDLREANYPAYNLNGINPEKNPGLYAFKRGAAGKHGREVTYIGVFEARGGLGSAACVYCGEALWGARKAVANKVKKIRQSLRFDYRPNTSASRSIDLPSRGPDGQ